MASCLKICENLVTGQARYRQEVLIIPATIDNEKVLEISGCETQSNNYVKKIIIEEGVERIGFCAFLKFYQLQEVILPNSLKYIDERAFEYCKLLQEIVIPNNVQTIGDKAFYECNSLKKVFIAEGLLSIGDYAFNYCDLHEIILPESLEKIGSCAFSQSNNLKELVIPKNVREVGYVIVNSEKTVITVQNAQNAMHWEKNWFSKAEVNYLNVEDMEISLLSIENGGLAYLYGKDYNKKDYDLYHSMFCKRFRQFKRDFKDF